MEGDFMSISKLRIGKFALSAASAFILLGIAIAASASSSAAPVVRTDVKIQPEAAQELEAAKAPVPVLSLAVVSPQHLAAVHPYVETPDSADTITRRVESK
jgi:hypothetical protein